MPRERNGYKSRIRERETSAMRTLRSKHGEKFRLAERILDFGVQLADGRRIRHQSGDRLAGRVLMGLYVKTLAIFWAIITLAERGLPSSSLMRELVEVLVSLMYIAQEDTAARAERYRDYLPIRDLKNMNRRLRDPDTRDTVTPKEERAVQAAVAEVTARRGEAVVEEMRRWPTWGGDFSLEAMARKAGLPGTVYNLSYAAESRAVHAYDAAEYLRLDERGVLQAQMPRRLEQHLLPACMTVLTAMDTISTQFGLDREDDLQSLFAEVERLNQERRREKQRNRTA